MSLVNRMAHMAIAGVMALGLASSALAATDKTTNTLLGAGLGAAAGAVLSEGDPMLTIGGAAVGGLLGNVLTEDRRYNDRYWHGNDRRYYRGGHNNYRRASYYRGKGKHGHYKKRHRRD